MDQLQPNIEVSENTLDKTPMSLTTLMSKKKPTPKTEQTKPEPQNPEIQNITDNLTELEKCNKAVRLEVIKMLNRNILEMAKCCKDNDILQALNKELNGKIKELGCNSKQYGGTKRTRRRKAKRKSKRKSKRHSRR